MQIEILKSKIHRVSISDANLDYIGSIVLDKDLMEAANIIESEKVTILNINNGERLDTYVIEGKRGSGDVIINGPLARRMYKGDIIIIVSYALMPFEEAKKFKPSIVFPNEQTNKIN